MEAVTPGRYRHFKGGTYVVTGVGIHTEDNTVYVIYRPENASGLPPHVFHIRPKTMFQEDVEVRGRTVPRFERIGD